LRNADSGKMTSICSLMLIRGKSNLLLMKLINELRKGWDHFV